MARIKNVTDDPLDVPSLGLFAVKPGEIVDVPDAKAFEGSELWQVTTTSGSSGKPKAQRKPRQKAPKAPDPAPPADVTPDVPTDGAVPNDEEPSL